jgi:hypothetical protein
MADVKIPISASVKGVTDELTAVERKLREVEKAAERLGKIRFQPIDANAIGAELKKLEQMMLETHRRVQGAGGGMPGGAAPGTSVVPAGGGGNNLPPRARAPLPRGPGAYTHHPAWHSIGSNFVGGVGGGFGMMANYGTRGWIAGSRDGGVAGGGLGLLRGLGIGGLALGALKIGQGINEGYELAKGRAESLDTLKRRLGDVGIGYDRLKAMSDRVGAGLGVNGAESAQLMLQFSRASSGRGAVGDGTRVGLGLSRAYGLEPGAGVGFVGSMASMDRRQNNRELAIQLAEAINKSGMSARADDVMQAFQGFASSVSRMVLGTGGMGGFSSAYSSLMGVGGMTHETAVGMLGAANSSVMRMGGAGEAGQNFTLTALSRFGRLNPIQAAALSEGGLFGSRAGVFGPGSEIARFIGPGGMPGGDMNATNFHALRQGIRGLGGDRWLQLDAAKRYFGVGSLTQAAALMNLDDKGSGQLMGNLKRAGIDINKVNASGIQALAALGPNASRDDLLKAANANREETEFTKMQDSLKALDDIKINTGDRLIGPINDMRSFLGAIAGKIAPDSAAVRMQKQFEGDLAGGMGAHQSSLQSLLGGELSVTSSRFNRMTPAEQAAVRQRRAGAESRLAAIGQLTGLEDKYGLPKGLLYGMWGTESSFGKNTGRSQAGASGHFQFMPGTAQQYGVKVGDFGSEADGAARYMQALIRKHGGDVKAALFEYNGVVKNTAAGEDYVAKVARNSAGISDVTPLPATGAGAGRGSVNPATVNVEGTFTLQDQRGNQIAAPVSTRVSVPRSAGVR